MTIWENRTLTFTRHAITIVSMVKTKITMRLTLGTHELKLFLTVQNLGKVQNVLNFSGKKSSGGGLQYLAEICG